MTNDSHHPDLAIFISSLRGGGAERVICQLANAFVDRGIRTDLLLAREEGPYLSDVSPQVRIIGFDAFRPIVSLWPLVRYLRRERPKALLSALDHSNLIAVAARHLSRIPVRHVVSQRVDPSIRPSLRYEPLEIFNYWLMGLGYRHADAVVAVSEGVRRSLEEVHGVPSDLIHVVYNSVEIPEVDLEPAGTRRHSWLEDGGSPIILAAGRLTRQKGFDTLLRAFRTVRSDRPSRLVILGAGEEERALKDLARSLDVSHDVLFPGFVDDPWIWMRRANVFVLSSRFEGLPGVLLQAMACGTRVVSTDCPSGPAEILEDGKWGRLAPVDRPAPLAHAILRSLDDPHPPPVKQRAASFDSATMVNGYLRLLGIEPAASSDHELPAESR